MYNPRLKSYKLSQFQSESPRRKLGFLEKRKAHVLNGKRVPRATCVSGVPGTLERGATGIDKSLKERKPKEYDLSSTGASSSKLQVNTISIFLL